MGYDLDGNKGRENNNGQTEVEALEIERERKNTKQMKGNSI